jgi:hypothetical protein
MVTQITNRQQKTLERINQQYLENQHIADKIINAVEVKHGHIFIGVSSEGLHFYQMDSIARQVVKSSFSDVKALSNG